MQFEGEDIDYIIMHPDDLAQLQTEDLPASLVGIPIHSNRYVQRGSMIKIYKNLLKNNSSFKYCGL